MRGQRPPQESALYASFFDMKGFTSQGLGASPQTSQSLKGLVELLLKGPRFFAALSVKLIGIDKVADTVFRCKNAV